MLTKGLYHKQDVMTFVDVGCMLLSPKLKSIYYVQIYIHIFSQQGTTAIFMVPGLCVNIEAVFPCIATSILKIRYHYKVIHILTGGDLHIESPPPPPPPPPPAYPAHLLQTTNTQIRPRFNIKTVLFLAATSQL